MTNCLQSARKMISRCIRLREIGKSEAVLRGELASWLRQIFPDDSAVAWINHYSEGTEAVTRINRSNGALAYRFIDNLVHSTTIEYERDLRKEACWNEGYRQVHEHIAGLLRSGTPCSQARGVLSDTVDWHVFDVELAHGIEPAVCRPEDVSLSEIETLKLVNADEASAQRLIEFIRRHLAREQSRPLTAKFIENDIGLESPVYNQHSETLSQLVEYARDNDTSVSLATDLWSHFVDYLESNEGQFRTAAYVDEAYITLVARLLCANVLQKQACLSDNSELSAILTGQLFEDRFCLHNMIEQDYFGWMTRPEYLPQVLPVARGIQLDLYAYDFSRILEEDMFGRLMTQLARRTQRKLLGQEWTPQWIARVLADKCLDLKPASELPCFVDICCGSGSIISEVLKATRTRYPSISFMDLSRVVTGFDIDPLAVLLAKTTWVATLSDAILASAEPVTVPIYHADSLFAITPITRELPMPGEVGEIIVELDGHSLSLPAELIGPELRNLFDDIIDWCYDEARSAQEAHAPNSITTQRAEELLNSLLEKYQTELLPDLRNRISQAVYELACRMAELAVSNRNGIWAFILRNTYRPGLLAGQFNGLVSNPPWLTMSQFADNPYKEQLSNRALAYGIKPSGAAHLHLELATTHLLHAVDRYLKIDAGIACLIPRTTFNGQHQAKLRDAAYLESDRPIPFELKEIWDIAPGTFNVRSAAIIGIKRNSISEVDRSHPTGASVDINGIYPMSFGVSYLGNRTAWVIGEPTFSIAALAEAVPPQGADLMPRLAVCVEVLARTGREWRVRTPRRQDNGFFAVKSAKKLKGHAFNGFVAQDLIHHMVQSLNLLPFTLDGNFVTIAIPARRDDVGQWEIMDTARIRTLGFTRTARRFQRINRAMANDNVVKPLNEYIDYRHKLSQQIFLRDQYLVLNGAGGGVACAACLSLADHDDIVIDQTLYWTLVPTEREAWYRVGLMNTDVLTMAISQFNPEGELGPRHLHTLPNRIIPQFDSENSDHMQIANLSQRLSSSAQSLVAADEKIANPSHPIAFRRRRLRNALKQDPVYEELEEVCTIAIEMSP